MEGNRQRAQRGSRGGRGGGRGAGGDGGTGRQRGAGPLYGSGGERGAGNNDGRPGGTGSDGGAARGTGNERGTGGDAGVACGGNGRAGRRRGAGPSTEAEGSAEPETATEGPGEPAGQSGGISAGPEAEAGTAAAATEAVTATPGAEGSATPEAAATAAVTPESVALEAEALAAAAGNGEAELSEQERAASSRVLRNRANGRFQVKLPKLLTGRRNIEVRLDGYKLSMGLEGAQRSVGEASEERGDTTGLDGNGRRIYRGLSSGKVRYPEALAGADLEYVVEGTRLKENLVLKEEPAAGFAVTYRLRGNKLEAELQEDGSVKLVNGKTGAAVGRLGQPVLYDAAGEESREVAVELAAGKRPGEYQITYRPSEQYLGQATYPVVLDPLIEAETAGTNIRDAKVCSGEPDKNYQAEGYLGAGRHSSRGVERFYIAGPGPAGAQGGGCGGDAAKPGGDMMRKGGTRSRRTRCWGTGIGKHHLEQQAGVRQRGKRLSNGGGIRLVSLGTDGPGAAVVRNRGELWGNVQGDQQCGGEHGKPAEPGIHLVG